MLSFIKEKSLKNITIINNKKHIFDTNTLFCIINSSYIKTIFSKLLILFKIMSVETNKIITLYKVYTF